MVIGHDKGISKYNGVAFNACTISSGATALSFIVESRKENFLAGNFYNEVFLINETNEVIKIDSLSQKEPGIGTLKSFNNKVYLKKGNSIFLVWDGVKYMNQKLICIKHASHIYDFIVDNDSIYVLTSDSIFIMPIQNTLEYTLISIPISVLVSLTEINNQVYLLYPFEAKLFSWKEKNFISLEKFNPNDKVNCIKQLKDGNIAIGTFGGLYIYNSKFEFIAHYFKEIQISYIFEDLEQNVWLGTLQDGIRILQSWTNYNLNSQTTFGQKAKISNSVVLNDTTIAVGTYQGKVFIINHDGAVLHRIDFNQKNEVQGMYFDSKANKLFAFCKDLFTINGTNFKIEKAEYFHPVKDLFTDSPSNYLASSYGFFTWTDKLENAKSLSGLWTKKIIRLNDFVFLETENGVLRYDLINQRFSSFKGDSILKFGSNICSNGASEILFTVPGGVYSIYNNKINKIAVLENYEIVTMTVYKDNIWISDGVSIKHLTPQTIFTYDKTKGIANGEIIKLIVLNDNLWIISTDNIQKIQTKGLYNSVAPQLKIENIEGSFKQKGTHWHSDFKANELRINLSVLPNITSQGTNKVYYKIEGVHQDWQVAENNLVYSIHEERLPYGDFVLELFCENEDGVRSDSVFLKLHISSPYYYTWWFWGILVALFLILVGCIFKWRINFLKRKNDEKLQQELLKVNALKAELKALRSQMDPHFIFNSLSSIQTKILDSDPIKAYHNLSSFSKLLRSSLTYTSKEFISLKEELEFIENYLQLEQLRTDESFKYQINVSPEIQTKNILFPSLLTQPFVENSIRHGLMHASNSDKLVSISITKEQKELVVQIQDNGIGRKKSQALNSQNTKYHESFASQAIADRIKLINQGGIYTVSSSIEDLVIGTLVTIIISKNE